MGTEENSSLEPRELWQREYDKAHLRDVPFETMSGVPVDPSMDQNPIQGNTLTRGLPIDV